MVLVMVNTTSAARATNRRPRENQSDGKSPNPHVPRP
jgi:hypothetical protein